MSYAGLLKSAVAKPLLFVLCLVPLALLVIAGFTGDLGANPVETITHETGDWALRFLLITLAVTPVCKWSKNAALMRFRRMLGLYAFFYACCHFSIWLIADHSLNIADMFEDIVKRPYITLGFSAFVVMIPLALTSNRAMVRRLGRRWNRLHKLTYLVAVLVILHYLWLVKADYLEPGIYAAITLFLLSLRVRFPGLKTTGTSPS